MNVAPLVGDQTAAAKRWEWSLRTIQGLTYSSKKGGT